MKSIEALSIRSDSGSGKADIDGVERLKLPTAGAIKDCFLLAPAEGIRVKGRAPCGAWGKAPERR